MENKKNYENLKKKSIGYDKTLLLILSFMAIFSLLGNFIAQFDSTGPISGIFKIVGIWPFVGINNGGIFELFGVGLLIVLIGKIHKNQNYTTILLSLVLLFLMYFYINGIITDQNMTFLRYNPIFQK